MVLFSQYAEAVPHDKILLLVNIMEDLKEAFISSSLTSVSFILQAERTFLRMFWTLITFACIVTFCVFLAQSIQRFYEFPVGVAITVSSHMDEGDLSASEVSQLEYFRSIRARWNFQPFLSAA